MRREEEVMRGAACAHKRYELCWNESSKHYLYECILVKNEECADMKVMEESEETKRRLEK